MTRNGLAWSVMMMAGLLLTQGCGDAPLLPDASVRVLVQTPLPNELTTAEVDQPADAIRVEIGELYLHRTDGTWIEVVPEAGATELVFGGAPVELAVAELPAGEYDQVRLVEYDAEVTVGDQTAPLRLVADAPFGFDAHGSFCVNEAPQSLELELLGQADADAEPEIQPAEDLYLRWEPDQGLRHSEAWGYWLAPTVLVEDGPDCD